MTSHHTDPSERFLYHQDEKLTLYTGDAQQVLATLPAASVDIVVTSPPYYGLRDYRQPGQYGLEPTPQDYVNTMVNVFGHVPRVLKPTGTLWLVLGDSYSLNSGGAPQSGTYSGYRSPDTTQPRLVRLRTQDILPAKNLIGIPWRVALALQDTRQWILRQAVVWHKPNAIPESVRDRPSCSHEYIFILSRSRFYYFDLDAIRVPLSRLEALDGTRIIGGRRTGTQGGIGATARRRGVTPYGANQPKYVTDPAAHHRNTGRNNLLANGRAHRSHHPRGKSPGSVCSIPTRPFREAHFAVYPIDIPLRAIIAGSPPGGVTLDPFSGAGTTGLAALQLGRTYVGIDINAGYHDIALVRIDTPRQHGRHP